MSKKWGNTRLVRPMTTREQNIADFDQRVASGELDMSISYVDKNTGAYVAYMKGHNYFEEEIEVAKAMAANGINVVLTPEGNGHEMYATNILPNKDDTKKYKYSEGTLSIYTYEQRTTTNITTDKNTTIMTTIKHANSKRSDIAVLYDKNNIFHRGDIEAGMKYYQSKVRGCKNKAKALIVVNSKGEVYEHQFDET